MAKIVELHGSSARARSSLSIFRSRYWTRVVRYEGLRRRSFEPVLSPLFPFFLSAHLAFCAAAILPRPASLRVRCPAVLAAFGLVFPLPDPDPFGRPGPRFGVAGELPESRLRACSRRAISASREAIRAVVSIVRFSVRQSCRPGSGTTEGAELRHGLGPSKNGLASLAFALTGRFSDAYQARGSTGAPLSLRRRQDPSARPVRHLLHPAAGGRRVLRASLMAERLSAK